MDKFHGTTEVASSLASSSGWRHHLCCSILPVLLKFQILKLMGRFRSHILYIASARLIVCSTWGSIQGDRWFFWFQRF